MKTTSAGGLPGCRGGRLSEQPVHAAPGTPPEGTTAEPSSGSTALACPVRLRMLDQLTTCCVSPNWNSLTDISASGPGRIDPGQTFPGPKGYLFDILAIPSVNWSWQLAPSASSPSTAPAMDVDAWVWASAPPVQNGNVRRPSPPPRPGPWFWSSWRPEDDSKHPAAYLQRQRGQAASEARSLISTSWASSPFHQAQVRNSSGSSARWTGLQGELFDEGNVFVENLNRAPAGVTHFYNEAGHGRAGIKEGKIRSP